MLQLKFAAAAAVLGKRARWCCAMRRRWLREAAMKWNASGLHIFLLCFNADFRIRKTSAANGEGGLE